MADISEAYILACSSKRDAYIRECLSSSGILPGTSKETAIIYDHL